MIMDDINKEVHGFCVRLMVSLFYAAKAGYRNNKVKGEIVSGRFDL